MRNLIPFPANDENAYNPRLFKRNQIKKREKETCEFEVP